MGCRKLMKTSVTLPHFLSESKVRIQGYESCLQLLFLPFSLLHALSTMQDPSPANLLNKTTARVDNPP